MPATRVRWALLGVMLAMLLSMLDNMVVGTSMPTIVRELGGLDHISWVVTAYTLTTAAATPVCAGDQGGAAAQGAGRGVGRWAGQHSGHRPGHRRGAWSGRIRAGPGRPA